VVRTLTSAVLGALLAIGVLGALTASLVSRPKIDADHPKEPEMRRRLIRLGLSMVRTEDGVQGRSAVVGIVVGIAAVGLTGWPAAAVFGVVVWLALPMCLRRTRAGDGARRAEAIAGWAELLRDALSASAGLAQALIATAPSAPTPIRAQASAMAIRLTNGVGLESALRTFAAEVDDASADFVVCALLLAASSRAQRLTEVLGALVETIRDTVGMHLRVDAGRAAARSSVRTIVVFSMSFVVLLLVLAHAYLSPFGTAQGQLVLFCVALLYAAGLRLMMRLVRPAPEPRLFDIDRLP
jgi:tight adherence protein B